MDTDTSKSQPGKARGSRKLLIASLALNLLLIGVLVGAGLNRARGSHRDIGGDRSFGMFMGALSEDDRRAMRRAAASEMAALREMRGSAQVQNDQLLAALRAEPYDAAAVAAALHGLRGGLKAAQDMGERLLLERITAMDRSARQDFVAKLEEALQKRRPGRKP